MQPGRESCTSPWIYWCFGGNRSGWWLGSGNRGDIYMKKRKDSGTME